MLTNNGQEALFPQHHIRFNGHAKVSFVMQIQDQVQVLYKSFRVVQFHIVHSQVLYIRKLSTDVQVPQL